MAWCHQATRHNLSQSWPRCHHNTSLGHNELIHCGLVMPYGDTEMGQHWLRLWLIAWQHLGITWTNADFSLARFYGIQLRAISLWVLKLLFCVMSLKIILLTHWGRATHICVGKLTIIGSDNGLSPKRHHAIIWTNAGILLIRHLGTNFSEILIRNQTFSLKKIYLKMWSAKWRPFCLGPQCVKITATSPRGKWVTYACGQKYCQALL